MVEPVDINNVSKVELHVHLEGFVSPSLVAGWAGKASATDFSTALTAYRRRTRSFAAFVDVLQAGAITIPNLGALGFLLRHALTEQRGQQVVLTEFTYSPWFFARTKGWGVRAQVDALRNVLHTWNEQNPGSRGGLILDITDDTPSAIARELIAIAEDGEGVVGINYSGDEASKSIYRFIDLLRFASDRRVPVTIHLGEVLGPEECMSIIRRVRPRRVGHGVRIAESAAALQEMCEAGIAVEVCVTSNLYSGAITDVAMSPLRRFLDAGVRVSINSDDPVIFATTITDEIRLCIDNGLLNLAELPELAASALGTSFQQSRSI